MNASVHSRTAHEPFFVVDKKKVWLTNFVDNLPDEGSCTLLIIFSPEWVGTIRIGCTNVLVFTEIDCGNWLARGYMSAHQQTNKQILVQ